MLLYKRDLNSKVICMLLFNFIGLWHNQARSRHCCTPAEGHHNGIHWQRNHLTNSFQVPLESVDGYNSVYYVWLSNVDNNFEVSCRLAHHAALFSENIYKCLTHIAPKKQIGSLFTSCWMCRCNKSYFPLKMQVAQLAGNLAKMVTNPKVSNHRHIASIWVTRLP